MIIVEEIEFENNASEENAQGREREKEKKATLPTGKNVVGFSNEANLQKIELENKDKEISEKEQMILSLQNEKKTFEEMKGKLEIAVGLKELAIEEKEKELLLMKRVKNFHLKEIRLILIDNARPAH